METKYTKADYIEWAYDDATYDDMPSEGCYALAIAAAHELGGVETYNSNDGNHKSALRQPARLSSMIRQAHKLLTVACL